MASLHPNVTVQFVPDPANVALGGSRGRDRVLKSNFKITSMGRAGLPVGKYKVVVTAKPTAEEEAAQRSKYEDDEQRRMAMMSLGIDPGKQAIKEGKPGGEFPAEVSVGDNPMEFDVKGKSKAGKS